MTDVYELDGAALRELPAAHDYLQRTLGFPDWYGKNLDALFDLLTEISRETILWISDADAVEPRLLRTILDAEDADPYLTVILSEDAADEASAADDDYRPDDDE